MQLEGDLNPLTFSRNANEQVLVFGGIFSEYEPLSNWGKFPVKYGGEYYPTLEHGYMHRKCLINDDVRSAQEVLDSSEAYMAKQIGDRVKIKKEKWNDQKSEVIMAQLLEAKFTPGSELAKVLLATGTKYLAESGRNQRYACGLSITHRNILDRTAHTGGNRLGHLIMERRQFLRQQST